MVDISRVDPGAFKLNGSFSTLTEHAEEVRLESPASRQKDGSNDVGTSRAVRW
jgi:hypothetical protein